MNEAIAFATVVKDTLDRLRQKRGYISLLARKMGKSRNVLYKWTEAPYLPNAIDRQSFIDNSIILIEEIKALDQELKTSTSHLQNSISG